MDLSSVNVVISFPVRNEEDNIRQVLDAIGKQELMPIRVVIANDGSTDNTEQIARSYDFVDVHNREMRENKVVGKKEMANVWNSSIIPVKKINENIGVDYIVFLGGDIILPPDYVKKLVKKFEQNENLVAAAGKMTGEYRYESTGFMIPGPGRMMRYNYWLELGGEYPFKHGWEAYPIYKANVDGYTTKIFDDIEYYPMRPTGGSTDYYAYGEAMKALGYYAPYVIGRCLKTPFMQARGIGSAWNMLKGYIFGNPELYEPELRKFVKNYQKKRLKRVLNPFSSTIPR